MEKKKKTRAEIEKESRKRHNLKSFGVYLEASKIEKLNKQLAEDNKTKTQWVNEQIDEYTKKC